MGNDYDKVKGAWVLLLPFLASVLGCRRPLRGLHARCPVLAALAATATLKVPPSRVHPLPLQAPSARGRSTQRARRRSWLRTRPRGGTARSGRAAGCARVRACSLLDVVAAACAQGGRQQDRFSRRRMRAHGRRMRSCRLPLPGPYSAGAAAPAELLPRHPHSLVCTTHAHAPTRAAAGMCYKDPTITEEDLKWNGKADGEQEEDDADVSLVRGGWRHDNGPMGCARRSCVREWGVRWDAGGATPAECAALAPWPSVNGATTTA